MSSCKCCRRLYRFRRRHRDIDREFDRADRPVPSRAARTLRYRMLGSAHDAEDARCRTPTCGPGAPSTDSRNRVIVTRTWLYRIATTTRAHECARPRQRGSKCRLRARPRRRPDPDSPQIPAGRRRVGSAEIPVRASHSHPDDPEQAVVSKESMRTGGDRCASSTFRHKSVPYCCCAMSRPSRRPMPRPFWTSRCRRSGSLRSAREPGCGNSIPVRSA